MARCSVQCFAKGGVGLLAPTVAQVNRSSGVPGIRRTLARIQLTLAFELELAGEFFERPLLVVTCGEYQPVQEMQTHRLEPSAFGALRVLRRAACAQLFQGRLKGLTRDEYRCRKPVRERQPWAQCQDAVRRTK